MIYIKGIILDEGDVGVNPPNLVHLFDGDLSELTSRNSAYQQTLVHDLVIFNDGKDHHVIKNRYGRIGKIGSKGSVTVIPKTEPIESKINVPQAKKFFYDWLDRNRPWNKHENKANVYVYMEELVREAAACFTNERVVTEAHVDHLEDCIKELTENLADHPKGYEGPCMCYECCHGGE